MVGETVVVVMGWLMVCVVLIKSCTLDVKGSSV